MKTSCSQAFLPTFHKNHLAHAADTWYYAAPPRGCFFFLSNISRTASFKRASLRGPKPESRERKPQKVVGLVFRIDELDLDSGAARTGEIPEPVKELQDEVREESALSGP